MSERFGGPSFEYGLETIAVHPEHVLIEAARTIAHELLAGPEDALTREIAEKILAKAEIKDRVDDLFAYADDVSVYQDLKKLGVFVVRDATATFDYDDNSTGFSIRKGDSYLDLHVPPVPKGLRSRAAVEASLDLVGQYIQAQELDPKYIMGITYARMAKLAERQFGFGTIYPNPTVLPDAVITGVQRVYQDFTEAGARRREIGLPALVFMESPTRAKTQKVRNHLGILSLRDRKS